MKFTYQAPKEYNDLSTGLRTVESEYLGPHDIKIYVSADTHKIEHVEFDHDGHPEVHNGTDTSADVDHMFLVYLHSHNPNHIALMAMICNHEDHPADNKIDIVCEKYNMVYQHHEPPSLDHTYDYSQITIDKNGVVTYPWWKLKVTWEDLVKNGRSHRLQIAERLRTDILTEEQRKKGNFCLEIIDYVILNEISKDQPWKIAWPTIDSVCLENTLRIGLPDDIPNGSREMLRTTEWGVVPHEHCCHIDGDDCVLESVCPTTAAEAAVLSPWTDLCCDHPTHSTNVALWNTIRTLLIANDPDIHLTKDVILKEFKAWPDINTTTEKTSLIVDAAHGVLSNDTTPDGVTLTVSEVNGHPADVGHVARGTNGGTFIINSDGSYQFTPGTAFIYLNKGETATTEVEYTALASTGETSIAKLTIIVTGTDNDPVIGVSYNV